MEATAEKAELVRAVSRIHQALDPTAHRASSTHGNVIVRAVVDKEGAGITFYGTDLRAMCGANALADVKDQGDVVLELASLKRKLEALPDGAVMLRLTDKRLVLSGGQSRRLWMQVADTTDYPREIEIPEEYSTTVSGPRLAQVMRRVENCREHNVDHLPQLSGIQLRVDTNEITAKGLSGHKAARASLPLEEPAERPWEGFVPHHALRTLMDMCDEAPHVTLSRDQSGFFAMTDETMLGHLLPREPVPPSDQLFGLEMEPMCVVDRALLMGSLSAMQHAGAINDHIQVHCDEDELRLELHQGLTSGVTAVDRIAMDESVRGCMVCAYPRDIVSALRGCDAPRIRLEIMPGQYFRATGLSNDETKYDGTFEVVFPIVKIH